MRIALSRETDSVQAGSCQGGGLNQRQRNFNNLLQNCLQVLAAVASHMHCQGCLTCSKGQHDHQHAF